MKILIVSEVFYPENFIGKSTFPFFIQYGHHDDSMEIHDHGDFFELTIVLDGTAMHNVNGESYFIKKGDVFAVNESLSHSFTECHNFRICNIMFRSDEIFAPFPDLKHCPGFHSIFMIEPFMIREQKYKNRLRLSISDFEKALSDLAKANEESARNTQAVNDLLKQQAEQEQLRKEQEAAAKAAEEARQQKLAEEAAAKKAYEEELAKKNAELQAQMNKVNDAISMGKTKLSMGEVEEALEYFETARENLPTEEKEFCGDKLSEIAGLVFEYYEGDTITNEGDKDLLKDASLEYSNQALSYNNSEPIPHYVKGRIAADNKDYETAEEELKLAVQYDNSNYINYFELGKIQYSRKKYTDASRSFTTAAKLAPNFENAQYNLGMTYEKLNQVDNAITAYKKAISIKNDYAKAHLQLARLLNTKKSDYSGSIAEYLLVLNYDLLANL